MRWADVIDNPLLQNLPFKIELNRWGRIEMSPASNQHGAVKSDLVARMAQLGLPLAWPGRFGPTCGR
jgi:hypothetical protein